jgi:hypothetical protein
MFEDAFRHARTILDQYVRFFRMEVLVAMPVPDVVWAGSDAIWTTREFGPWVTGEFSATIRCVRADSSFIESEISSPDAATWERTRTAAIDAIHGANFVRVPFSIDAEAAGGTPGPPPLSIAVLLTPYPGPIFRLRGRGAGAVDESKTLLRPENLRRLAARCDPFRSLTGEMLCLAPSIDDSLDRLRKWQESRAGAISAHALHATRDLLEGITARWSARTLGRLDRVLSGWFSAQETLGGADPFAETTVAWRNYRRREEAMDVVVECGPPRIDTLRRIEERAEVLRWGEWIPGRGSTSLRHRTGISKAGLLEEFVVDLRARRGRVLIVATGREAAAQARAISESSELEGLLADPD